MNIVINNYLKHKETIHNFTWRALQIFGKQGVTFLIFILCAKLLTPYDFGVYNYILAIIFFLIIFGDFGISTATSKYVAEYNTINKDKLKLIPFNSLLIIVSLGVIVSLLVVLFGEFYLKEKYVFVLYALPMLFLAPISSLYDGIYRGLKRFKELAIISVSVGVLAIGFVYFLVSQYGLIGAIISQSLFYLLLVFVLTFRYGLIKAKIDKKLMKTIVRYSTVIGVASISYFLYSRVDIIVLEYFGYIEEIGYYELVNRLFVILLIPFVIFAQIIAPNITKYYSRKEFSIVRNKFKKYTYYTVIISASISLLVYLTYPFLMNLFFKEYFTANFILMINVLLPLFVIKALGGGIIMQGFTTPTGYAHLNMKLLLIFGPLNLILNIIFINLFGFIGVIYSTFITWSFTNLLLIGIYYNRIKND